jgi:hypothetical protein
VSQSVAKVRSSISYSRLGFFFCSSDVFFCDFMCCGCGRIESNQAIVDEWIERLKRSHHKFIFPPNLPTTHHPPPPSHKLYIYIYISISIYLYMTVWAENTTLIKRRRMRIESKNLNRCLRSSIQYRTYYICLLYQIYDTNRIESNQIESD